MTWLLLDAGNSALKWATAEPPAHALQFGGTLGLDALPAALAAALAGRRLDAAFGCNVAGAGVARAIESALAVPPAWFGAQREFAFDGVRLRSGYRDSAQLGADRWHALLAARAAYPQRALVVVNAGTATTVDCISAGGEFVGGVIAPGVRLMFYSLAWHTAQLPLAAGALAARPDNTDDAITTGVLESQLGLIERRVRRFAAEEGCVSLLLDGGHAAALAAHLAFDPAQALVRQEPNLVLRGVLLRARAVAAER